jgi:hypothetical protein
LAVVFCEWEAFAEGVARFGELAGLIERAA